MAFSFRSLQGRLARAGRLLHDGFLDLLYPPHCLGCGMRPPARALLCASCQTRLERVSPEAVQHRLHALPKAHHVFATAFALWHFEPGGALRTLQHALKYQNRPHYGMVAGRWLGAGYQTTFPQALPSEATVVPVPLHRTRRLERGYNQSAMLARGAADALGRPCAREWLARARPTRSQTRLSREARWQNVAGAFEASPSLVRGRTVLLVDDVLTTGATATAAAQALHHAGAASVHLATLALAP